MDTNNLAYVAISSVTKEKVYNIDYCCQHYKTFFCQWRKYKINKGVCP
jgi:hypothetical protein